MSLPDTGTVSVLGGNDLPKAFLTKLPPHVWKMFSDSTQNKENFKISLDNGEFVSLSAFVIIRDMLISFRNSSLPLVNPSLWALTLPVSPPRFTA
jgi:hypothetical protein